MKRKMNVSIHKMQVGVAGALAGLLLMAAGFVPEAGAISYNLNCTLSGPSCSPSGPWGTIDYTQNGTNVDVKVDLNLAYTIDQIALNTSPSTSSSTYSTAVGVFTNFDNVAAAVYTGGKFDLRLPQPFAIIGGNSGTFTMHWNGGGLSVNDLALAKDTGGNVFAGVRLRNFNPACPACTVLVGTTGVPEPASLILLGAGLAGIGIWSWRRKLTKS